MNKNAIVFFQFLCAIFIAEPVLAGQTNSSNENAYSIHDIFLESETIGDEVYVTHQDANGFLWIGTDNGVRKYDGYKFKYFNHDQNDPESIGSDFVFDIMLDSKGQMWFAGNKNISLYHSETETFTVFDISEGNIVRTMLEGDDGLIWYGGDKFGIHAIDPNNGKTIHSIQFPNTVQYDVRSLIKDKDSHYLWVAAGNGLFKLNTQNLVLEKIKLPADFKLGNESIRQAIVDKQGMLWLATNQGILFFNPNTNDIRQYKSTDINSNNAEKIVLQNDEIWSVFQDSSENIWFGTGKTGLYQYNESTGQFKHFSSAINEAGKFPPGTIYNIFEDNQESLWVTFNTFGIRRMSKNLAKFNVLKQAKKNTNSLSLDNVLDMHEHSSGVIYIATDGGGLDKYDPQTGTFEHFQHDPNDPNSISSDSILSLAEDNLGQMWVGTWSGGLNVLDPKSGTFNHITQSDDFVGEQGLANNNIFRIETMPDGRLLLSVWTLGMQIYDPKTQTFESYFSQNSDPKTGIKNSAIQDFERTEDGNYWIGGVNGLELFDVSKRQFTQLLSDEDFGIIFDILTDRDGNLWLATSIGLTYFHPETKFFKTYSKKNGLSDNFVLSLEQDVQGMIWIGTRAGLSQFNPKDESFKVFDNGDGLAGMQFNRFAHLQTSNGDFYFGSVTGISVFNPNNLPRNERIPEVVITGIELFQQAVSPGVNSIIQQSIGATKKIQLNYNQRDITFEFSALNFVAPMNNLYRYRLEGLEDSFTEVDSSRRRVRYTNLDSGTYTFFVTGSNNDSVWSTEGTQIVLIIDKPWWESWWARSLAVLMILIGIKFQSDRNKRRRSILTEMVNEKTENLNEVNVELAEASKVAQELNLELERRVEERTAELSIEVEERRSAEAKMFHMAFHDALTNLPNRQWLIKHLNELILKCKKNANFKFALMFLDGDKFKHINDSRGHLVGDQVLIEASHRLRLILPEGCRPVRLGGDEFTIIAEGDVTEKNLLALGEKIITAFESPLIVNRSSIPFRMSIGMVICDHQYTKTEQVLRDADIAMYKAKELGRGLCQLFDKKMREDALETIELESDMLNGLENNEFFLVYQPVVHMTTRALVGFEALARWRHPTKGFISPDRFIALAEESGVILQIGEWVLNKALEQMKIWKEDPQIARDIGVSVNLSTKQLSDVNLVPQIDFALEKYGIDGKFLKLEITESALMENTKGVRRVLDELSTRNIDFAIDDFGTGYSSLAYLGQLPVQFLKIDRMFVNALFDESLDNQNASEIVSAIISLAHSLNISVVAEGIETEQQNQVLKDFNCLLGQGYLFSKPLEVEDAKQFIISGSAPTDKIPDQFTIRAVRK